MDWLLANRVMLDCAAKFVVFPSIPVESISLNLKPVVLYFCKTKNEKYVILSASEVELEQALSEIPVVKEYYKVFLEDICNISTFLNIA